MSDFYVGQEVVCVDGGDRPSTRIDLTFLVVGNHYVISALDQSRPAWGGVRVSVMEGIIPADEYLWPDRFAPIKSDTIEVFREMCRAVSIRHRTPEDIQNEFEGKGR